MHTYRSSSMQCAMQASLVGACSNIKMTPLLVLLLLASKVWSMTENNDQCCYFYGTAPHNDSNCIPDGQQLSLRCIVYNPRDTFTNLSVRWFRSSDMNAPAEDIAGIQDADYTFFTYFQMETSLQRNCTQGKLYADTFILGINNFTTDKDGYYWCNILVNDSFLEPSQRARFYAIESTSCIQQDPYFRPVPDRAQCASVTTSSDNHTKTATMSTTSSEDHTNTMATTMPIISSENHTDVMTTAMSEDHTNVMITTMSTTSSDDVLTTTIPTTSLDDHTDVVAIPMPTTLLNDQTDVVATPMPTTLLDDHTDVVATTMPTTLLDDHSNSMITTTVTLPPTPDMTSTIVLTTLVSITNTEPIPYYAVGILAVLVLLVGALIVLMLILYVHKSQKEKNPRNQVIRERHGEMDAIASNQETPVTIENVGSATLLENRSTTTTTMIDDEQDHTYDTAEFHDQADTLHEQPQYNTLQHGNNGNITNCDLTYEKVEIHSGKDAYNCLKFIKQAPRNTNWTDSYCDDVPEVSFTYESERNRTHQMMSHDYQPVYDGPHIKELLGKHALFDDEAYGTHRPLSKGASVQLEVDRVKSTPHSETISTVKKELLTSDKEVEYAEPLPPNAKSCTPSAQANGEHFYHSLECNEQMKAKECISGVPYSKESSNSVIKSSIFAPNGACFSELKSPGLALNDQVAAYAKCQTPTLTSLFDSAHAMDEVGTTLNAPIPFSIDQCEFDDPMYEGISHSVPKYADKNPQLSLDLFHEKMQTKHNSSPEEESCIGNLNDDPELLNHEEDMNAPEYGDPIDSEHLDDNNIAKDQRDQRVNIYDTFDDLA